MTALGLSEEEVNKPRPDTSTDYQITAACIAARITVKLAAIRALIEHFSGVGKTKPTDVPNARRQLFILSLDKLAGVPKCHNN
jgi:hypothetical protein